LLFDGKEKVVVSKEREEEVVDKFIYSPEHHMYVPRFLDTRQGQANMIFCRSHFKDAHFSRDIAVYILNFRRRAQT
jgi:hypothetical protein